MTWDNDSLIKLLQKGHIDYRDGLVEYTFKVGIETDSKGTNFVCISNKRFLDAIESKEDIIRLVNTLDLPFFESKQEVAYPTGKTISGYALPYVSIFNWAKSENKVCTFFMRARPIPQDMVVETELWFYDLLKSSNPLDDNELELIFDFVRDRGSSNISLQIIENIVARSPTTFVPSLTTLFKNQNLPKSDIERIIFSVIEKKYLGMSRSNFHKIILDGPGLNSNIKQKVDAEYEKTIKRLEIRLENVNRDWHCWCCHAEGPSLGEVVFLCLRCKWYVCHKCSNCSQDCHHT